MKYVDPPTPPWLPLSTVCENCGHTKYWHTVYMRCQHPNCVGGKCNGFKAYDDIEHLNHPVQLPRFARPLDERCFQHDHHFSDEDLYDYDGVPSTREAQLAAKCLRCGVTMEDSFKELITEIKNELRGIKQ